MVTAALIMIPLPNAPTDDIRINPTTLEIRYCRRTIPIFFRQDKRLGHGRPLRFRSISFRDGFPPLSTDGLHCRDKIHPTHPSYRHIVPLDNLSDGTLYLRAISLDKGVCPQAGSASSPGLQSRLPLPVLQPVKIIRRHVFIIKVFYGIGNAHPSQLLLYLPVMDITDEDCTVRVKFL